MFSAMAPKRADVEALLETYTEPVENFFAKALGRDFQCFGCSEHNATALGIQVLTSREPQEAPSALARIPAVGTERSSFPGIVHGGVLSAIAGANLLPHPPRVHAFPVAQRLCLGAVLAIAPAQVCARDVIVAKSSGTEVRSCIRWDGSGCTCSLPAPI